MKVICAGVPKTGTTSLAKALRILGYKTYDFREQMEFFYDEWDDMFTNGKKPDFHAMFKDVDAVTDTPASIVFEDIYECFPDAKVILTIRDNEQVWAKSYREHLGLWTTWTGWLFFCYFYLTKPRKFYRAVNSIDNAILGSRHPDSSFIHIKRYQWYNQRVQHVIPKDKLLVFNVKQGWKPLCEFLGREIPDEPFPRANVKGEEEKKVKNTALKKILLFVAFFVLCTAVIFSYIKF